MVLLSASPMWIWLNIWGGIGYHVFQVDSTKDTHIMAIMFLLYDPDIAIVSEYSYNGGGWEEAYWRDYFVQRERGTNTWRYTGCHDIRAFI